MSCYLIIIRFLSELTNAKTGAVRAVGRVAFATLRLLGLRFINRKFKHSLIYRADGACLGEARRAKTRAVGERNFRASPHGEAAYGSPR